MTKLILPGQDDKDRFAHALLVGLDDQIDIAVVEYPAGMADSYTPEEDDIIVFFLQNPSDEEHEGVKFTRYELHSTLYTPNGEPPDFDNITTRKDGYVFLPKSLRDGRHGSRYILQPIEQESFKFKTENGMYEEVYWSPFGDAAGAVRQEEANSEINPQLRRYNTDGLDKPDFL